MPEVVISDVPVMFPFKPYDVQVEFMSKVIQCLEERRHGVLESPTGTGKTLSLLCSTLAWLQQKKIKMRIEMQTECSDGSNPLDWARRCGKVIYASRTHSQLRQVIRQFNSTMYKDLFTPTIMGSRDHQCVHPQVKKETSLSHKNMRCSILIKQKQCKFLLNTIKHSEGPINLIDELDKPDQCKTYCPYYLARETVPTSDIIFMPYNYLIDLQLHKNFKFSLENCIVIIDEGHNVAKVCEESSSVSFSSANIAACLSDLVEEMQNYYDDISSLRETEGHDYSSDDLVFLQQRLQKLDTWFSNLSLTGDGVVNKGSHVFQVFSECEINEENKHRFIELLAMVGDNIAGRNTSGSFSTKGLSLKRLSDSLMNIFSSLENNTVDNIDFSFKVYLEKESSNFKNRNMKTCPIVLHYWCFNPGFLLKKLLDYNLRSIIVTSGTLSPLHAVVEELGFTNAVTLSSKHIVEPFQVKLCTLAKGPCNYELKCIFSNREDKTYWRELGMTLVNLSRHIPHGLLVFFPSYITMNKAHEMWSSSGLLSDLSKIKTVFMEPNNKHNMEEVLANYSLAVDNNKDGAILFGVCRGKISEGLDFSGKYARGVIITGIPYAPPSNKKVALKRDFININRNMFKGLTGDEWYQIDAMRAINQAVGRAIRHSADYGVIVLCDSRLHQNMTSNKRLPSWLLPFLVDCPTFSASIQNIKGFFKAVKEKEHLLNFANISVPRDAIVNEENDTFINLPAPQTPFLTTGPSSSRTSVSLVQGPSASQALACSSCTPPSTSLNAERLRHNSLFNRAVVETNISTDTQLQIKPARKRKIKIIDSDQGALEDIRHSEVKSFILDVKLTLDEQSYSTFTFIVKKYHQTNNFDETIDALKSLFLSPDVGCQELFKGCYRLFSETHQLKFAVCVQQLFNT